MHCHAQTNHSLVVDEREIAGPALSYGQEYWLGNLNNGLPTETAKRNAFPHRRMGPVRSFSCAVEGVPPADRNERM